MFREVFRVGLDPHYSQGMTDWITDRRPTAADADGDGDVKLRNSRDGNAYSYVPWEFVAEGAPWQPGSQLHRLVFNHGVRPDLCQPGPEPEARQRRFVSITRTPMGREGDILDAVADDGTAWCWRQGSWQLIPELPSCPLGEVPF